MTETPKDDEGANGTATKGDIDSAKNEVLSAIKESTAGIKGTVRESSKDYEDAVAAMRTQNSHEHGRMQRIHDWVASELGRIVRRFGFLSDKDAPEPPLNPPDDKSPP